MKWLVVFFVFSGIILSSFQHKTNLVLVEQIESNFPIVIRYDSICLLYTSPSPRD